MNVTIRKKSAARRGITLIEILICIGILAFGLLGVVSLIPVGHFAVAETTKADRSTACAKAAKAQIQLRGMLRPENWENYSGAKYTLSRDTIALDPLGVAYGTTDSLNFPYNHPPSPSTLRRYTTNDFLGSLGSSDRLCRWEDDVIVDVDDSDPDLRPRQTFVFDTGDFGPYPVRSTDDTPPAGNPIVRQAKGDYTWFLTVTPDEALAVEDLKTFDVSTVVCFKRNLNFDMLADVPPERLVEVDTTFAGISGAGASDIPLVAPLTATTTEKKLEYLKVKSGQWILLVGQQTIGSATRTVARWYRVLTVDDEMDASGTVRWITVTGPEWIVGTNPGEIQNTQAILVDDVIGVFTETMTVER